MRALVIILGVAIAFVLGVGSAFLSLRDLTPIDTIESGAWKGWPRAGTEDEDPYSRARLARTGELALGPSEGLKLLARSDDAGGDLNGACSYEISGQMPSARLWTISVETAAGGHLPPAERGGRALGSDEIVRKADGTFTITLAPNPQPGNWLSSEGAGQIRLAARLYDTTARTVTALTQFTVPAITPKGCR
ncbi:DUF1214 domain-containing protein [Afifella sp. JA880]|uniref:DUF1214 domain-containing protein n=1 Tax=Afifella sp. JA880 TaxID=2975280 RepID=UPI0021BB315B|nr:DUF1214 domain-containing protein [Afifella sp. JA880]